MKLVERERERGDLRSTWTPSSSGHAGKRTWSNNLATGSGDQDLMLLHQTVLELTRSAADNGSQASDTALVFPASEEYTGAQRSCSLRVIYTLEHIEAVPCE